MTTAVDEYVQRVIKSGDEGSALLAKMSAETLEDAEYLDVLDPGMNGLRVLRIPKDHLAVVHSAGGDPRKKDPEAYAASVVDKLTNQAASIGAKPLGFSNVIDIAAHDKSVLESVMAGLLDRALDTSMKRPIPILNGEYAILGSRVRSVNVSGTMISIIEKDTDWLPVKSGNFVDKGIRYSIFDPEGKPVYINSDGVGTKTEFYERAKKYEQSLKDFLAMNLDDAIKIGATARVASGVVETKGAIPFRKFEQLAKGLQEDLQVQIILQHEPVGNRIHGYDDIMPAFSLSGSVVSTINEERLNNPLKPRPGDYVIAIRGIPNPRSNGITDKRKITADILGQDWHKTREGKIFLEYLAQPSTILYPFYQNCIDDGIVSSTTHMSGGAHDGKLARPLAKHNLFAKLENLFPPDWRDSMFAGRNFATVEQAYGKWPMGNDGYVTTSTPDKVMELLEGYIVDSLEGRVVGRVEEAVNGKTGVEITTPSGKTVYFSGRAA